MDREIERQGGRQTGGHMDGWTGREIERQGGRQTGGQMDGWTGR